MGTVWNSPRLVIGVAGALVCAPTQGPAPFPACLARAPRTTMPLPPALKEVSGLALGDDGRLWLHNDELAVLGAIELATGKPLGSYRLGPQLLRGDFEGVAIGRGRLYLATSDGRLFSTAIPARGTPDGPVATDVIETGLGRQCEIEGLAFEPADRTLLLACKEPRAKSLQGRVTVFRWLVDQGRLATPDRIDFAAADLAKGRKGRQFRPSAIERHPTSGHYLILASADQAYALVDRTGTILATGELAKRHRQPEGLAIAPSGELLIADEGGNGTGTISFYACR